MFIGKTIHLFCDCLFSSRENENNNLRKMIIEDKKKIRVNQPDQLNPWDLSS